MIDQVRACLVTVAQVRQGRSGMVMLGNFLHV
jgi:hypothetical protein